MEDRGRCDWLARHRHRHRPGPHRRDDTTKDRRLLSGHPRGPRPGHPSGPFHATNTRPAGCCESWAFPKARWSRWFSTHSRCCSNGCRTDSARIGRRRRGQRRVRRTQADRRFVGTAGRGPQFRCLCVPTLVASQGMVRLPSRLSSLGVGPSTTIPALRATARARRNREARSVKVARAKNHDRAAYGGRATSGQ